MAIHVVGGCYREICHWPPFDEVHGSGGRAAQVIAQLAQQKGTHLHSVLDPSLDAQLRKHFAFLECEMHLSPVTTTLQFEYAHPLIRPNIYPSKQRLASVERLAFTVTAEDVVLFGMLEAAPSIHAGRAVYDPQDVEFPVSFRETGSVASQLVIILNRAEANTLFERVTGQSARVTSTELVAHGLLVHENARAVIVKCGRRGALVVEDSGTQAWVPAYRTANVFPIGSGDCFVGAFAYFWMNESQAIQEAAQSASLVTAFYCDTRSFPDATSVPGLTSLYAPASCDAFVDKSVYLAGPFFNLKEMWLINQARDALIGSGLRVFSPYHDVGMGSSDEVVAQDIDAIEACDALYAIFDGGDPGTLFEVGYAVKCQKTVVIYAENATREQLKMYEGTGCRICSDFASSIYQLHWALNG